MEGLKCTFKWQDKSVRLNDKIVRLNGNKSVRLNGKTKVNVVNGKTKVYV